MSLFLNFLIWFPILAALVILALPKSTHSANFIKWSALAAVIVSLGVALKMTLLFNPGAADMQFEINADWVNMLNIRYHLGIDGLSLTLIDLSIFTNIIIILATLNSIHEKNHQYLAAFLILQGL